MCSTLSFFIFILIAQHSLCNPLVDRDLPIGHQCLSLCKKKNHSGVGPSGEDKTMELQGEELFHLWFKLFPRDSQGGLDSTSFGYYPRMNICIPITVGPYSCHLC